VQTRSVPASVGTSSIVTSATLGCSAGSENRTAMTAFSLHRGFDPASLSQYPCTTFLLDTSLEAPDGTPAAYDWRKARTLGLYGKILIGGDLDPTNVALAVEQARPYGVDVVTGVEVAPGKKDLDRVERLVEAVRRAERRMEAEAKGATGP